MCLVTPTFALTYAYPGKEKSICCLHRKVCVYCVHFYLTHSAGDCRAVAGYWQKGVNGSGTWRVEVLTEDQTGRNPSEKKRQVGSPRLVFDLLIRITVVFRRSIPARKQMSLEKGVFLVGLSLAELSVMLDTNGRYLLRHSKSLSNFVLCNLTYMIKSESLHGAFFGPKVQSSPLLRGPPGLSKTPPYVTAEPVVTHKRIVLPDEGGNESLRFVVLATDGLWDKLS